MGSDDDVQDLPNLAVHEVLEWGQELCALAADDRQRAAAVNARVSTVVHHRLVAGATRLRRALEEHGRNSELIRVLGDLEAEARENLRHNWEMEHRVSVETDRAMTTLSRLQSLSRLVETGPGLLGAAAGFQQVLVSAVDGPYWLPLALWSRDPDETSARRLEGFIAKTPGIRLSRDLAESQIVRRHKPLLIEEAWSDPRTYKPIVEVADVPDYAGAPILVQGRVVGLIHIERSLQQRSLSPDDVRWAWRFALQFSQLYERTAGQLRLRQRDASISRALRSVQAAVGGVAGWDLPVDVGSWVSPAHADGGEPLRSGAASDARDQSPAHKRLARLSTRELEVLRLLSLGTSNQELADSLGVSINTTKSHLRRIYRKLGVDRRVAAVGLFRREQDSFGHHAGHGATMTRRPDRMSPDGSSEEPASKTSSTPPVSLVHPPVARDPDTVLHPRRARLNSGDLDTLLGHWPMQTMAALARLFGSASVHELVSTCNDLGQDLLGADTTWIAQVVPAAEGDRLQVISTNVLRPGHVTVSDWRAVGRDEDRARAGNSVLSNSDSAPGRQVFVAPMTHGASAVSFLYASFAKHPSDICLEAMRSMAFSAGMVHEQLILKHRLASQSAIGRQAAEELERIAAADLNIKFGTVTVPDWILPPHVAHPPLANNDPAPTLTRRQLEVLELMMHGLRNTEIAERLTLSVPTVKHHVRAILRHAGASNRHEAVAFFQRRR